MKTKGVGAPDSGRESTRSQTRKRGVVPQDDEKGESEGDPFARTPALARFPLPHDGGIETQAGIVEEDMAVDLADIDPGEPAGEEIGDGRLELQRDLQILGEVVERAQGQDAQRVLAAHQRRGDRAQSAVAAAGHHRLAPLRHGLARQFGKLAAVAGKDDTGLAAMTGEEVRDLLAGLLRPVGARGAIENAGDDGRSGQGIVEHLPS